MNHKHAKRTWYVLNDTENQNSLRVLEYIRENPGSHLRMLKRELKLSLGTIQYHLHNLEKQGKITSEKEGMFRYYFPIGMFQQNEKNILKILKHETARNIIMIIIEKTNPTQTEIVKLVGLSAPSISWNMDQLLKYDIISEVRDGKFKRYMMKEDPHNFLALMKTYHLGLWNKLNSRMADMFLSLSGEE